jgi:hypothetical protein
MFFIYWLFFSAVIWCVIKVAGFNKKLHYAKTLAEQAYRENGKLEMRITEIEHWLNSTVADTPDFKKIVEGYFKEG